MGGDSDHDSDYEQFELPQGLEPVKPVAPPRGGAAAVVSSGSAPGGAAYDPLRELIDFAETRQGAVASLRSSLGNGFVHFTIDVKPLDERHLKTAFPLLDSLPHPVFWISDSHEIFWSNPAARESYGTAMGKCHAVFHRHHEPCELHGEPCPLRAAAVINTAISVAHVHQSAGVNKSLEITAIPVEGGGVILIHIPVEDFFFIDTLTGARTRAHFEQATRRDLALMERMKMPYALVMLDLDHFKQLNDRHGHPAGDLMLQVVGRAINDNIRGTDSAGRWGGEEFCVFLPGINMQGAVRQVRRVQRAIRAIEIEYFASALSVTASFGIYSSSCCYDFNDAIRRADEALYRAKKLGRDRIEVS